MNDPLDPSVPCAGPTPPSQVNEDRKDQVIKDPKVQAKDTPLDPLDPSIPCGTPLSAQTPNLIDDIQHHERVTHHSPHNLPDNSRAPKSLQFDATISHSQIIQPTSIQMSPHNEVNTEHNKRVSEDRITYQFSPEVLGPLQNQLNALALAMRNSVSIDQDGGLILKAEESMWQLQTIADTLSAELPLEVVNTLVARSQLTWELFVGHCLSWWLTQRGHQSFLLCVSERASLHSVILKLKWNEGRVSLPSELSPSPLPLILGGVIGMISGQWAWWAPWPLTLSIGLTIGWLKRRTRWYCHGAQCGAIFSSKGKECPQCGVLFQPPKPQVYQQ